MSSVSNQLEKERAHTEKITRFQTYLFCFRIHISEQVEKPSKADSIQRFHPRHLVERRPAQKDTIDHRHHQRQPGEQQFPIQVAIGWSNI